MNEAQIFHKKCTTESAKDEFTDAAQKRNLLLKLPVKTQYKRPSIRLGSFLMSNYAFVPVSNLQILSNLKDCPSETISSW